jgi:hypothetical protein
LFPVRGYCLLFNWMHNNYYTQPVFAEIMSGI